jgi:hypothetical protein
MVVRGEVLPMYPLNSPDRLAAERPPGYGVLMQTAEHSAFILAIDNFAGREDAVIKSLDDFRPKGVAGVTTLSNGQIVLILDMKELHQRQRLAACPGLWQRATSWSAPDGNVPPEFAALFPVHVHPLAARTMLAPRQVDITLLYRCDATPELVASTGCLLQIGLHAGPARPTALAPDDEIPRLLHERAQLTQDIADLELELASVEAELDEFTRDYYARVGRLLAEQDALQASLARRAAERQPEDAGMRTTAEERERHAEQSASESKRFNRAQAREAPAVPRSEATKRLYRRIAQQIHPDRADDEADRAWRTQLMIEANHAYRDGDEQGLQYLAAKWKASRDSAPGANETASVPSTPSSRWNACVRAWQPSNPSCIACSVRACMSCS